MSRPRKTSVPFNMKFDAALMNRLSDYCQNTGATKTAAVERFVEAYLNEYEKTTSGFAPFKNVGKEEDNIKIQDI